MHNMGGPIFCVDTMTAAASEAGRPQRRIMVYRSSA